MVQYRVKPALSASLAVAGAALAGWFASGLFAQESGCGGSGDGSLAIRGFVLEVQASLAIDGARVSGRWSGGEAETTSRAGGLFELCGVPADAPLVLQVSVPPYEGPGVHLEPGFDLSGVMLTIDFATDEVPPYTSRIMGRLVDRQTLEPISNALVGNAVRGYTRVSDEAGRFLLVDLVPGDDTIKVRHLAYGERETGVTVSPGTLEVEIRLTPTVIALEPLEVRVVRLRSVKLERSGFYEREAWGERLGLGHFLTRDDIERRAPARLSHALADAPRVGMLRGCSGPQCSVPFIRGSGSRCRELKDRGGELVIGASVYVDGHRMRTAVGSLADFSLWGVDELMMPADVAGVEVYTGYGDLPGEFADSNAQRCGAIVIWTGV